MKNKKIINKIFIIVLSGIIFGLQDVSAEKLTGEFNVVKPANIGNSGLPGTHIMTFTKENCEKNCTYNAYCAWYERGTPPTGVITLAPISKVSDKHAMAIASIINANLSKKDGMPSDSDDFQVVQQVIKTTAINLYLTDVKELAGSPIQDSHRYDGLVGRPGAAATVIKEFYPINYFLIKNNDFEGLLKFFLDCSSSEFVTGGHADEMLCSSNSAVKARNVKYYKIVYDLITEARNIANNYKQASLKFINEDEDFTVTNGWYTKTYKATSNKNLTSISAKVTGIESSCYDISGGKTTGKNGSITVKIKQSCVKNLESLSEIKVEAEATTTEKKATVYTAENGVNISRTDFQDIVIADIGIEPVKVSTSDVIDRLYRTCYRNVVTCDTTECVNTNLANKRTCNSVVETYEAPSCDVNDVSNSANGKFTAELISGKCSLYCTEKATVSYPGNKRPAVTIGTNFTWPTSDAGNYPLKTEATLSCTVEMSAGTTEADKNACRAAATNYKYKNTKSGNLIYNDLEADQTIELQQNCSTSAMIQTGALTYVMTHVCSYTLPDDKNIAVDKKTFEFVNKVALDSSKSANNYILITQQDGILSVEALSVKDQKKLEALTKKKYRLEITNLALGNEGQFTSKLNSNDYVCNYKVTTDPQPYLCPPGTELAGTDLLGKLESGVATNYADAVEKFCNSDKITCTRPDGIVVDITTCINNGNTQKDCEKTNGCYEACPPGTSYEGFKYKEDDTYKKCVFGGGTEIACRDQVCNCPDCEYFCPPGTPLEGKDITDCVVSEVAKGTKQADAEKNCELDKCYILPPVGGEIIYRTISLENPFPSIDADKKTTQTGLTVGMFNDTIKGRYPGTNWNSVTLVKNKILNNRGYDGSAIYQEAAPLYIIELDAKAIKQIREYNKKQMDQDDGYDDFTLTCTDGAYCISSFLRSNQITTAKGESILTGGTCINASNKATFISCYKYK